jgi:hypothetical protein
MGRCVRRDDSCYWASARALATCFLSEFCNLVVPSFRKGAGKAGRRLRPQHRVQKRNNAHGFVRYSRDIPAFPAQWLYGLYVLSPGKRPFLPPLLTGLAANVAPGSRRQDHTTSPYAAAFTSSERTRLTPQRPSQPAPRFVTTAKRPSWRRGLSGPVPVICPTRQGVFLDFTNS